MAARQAQIDDLNRKHGLRPSHKRAKARTQREASVLKQATADQPF
jgi:hypothetical protein